MNVRGGAPIDLDLVDFGLAARECAGLALELAAHVVRGQKEVAARDGNAAEEHKDASGPAEDFSHTSHARLRFRRGDGSVFGTHDFSSQCRLWRGPLRRILAAYI